MCEVCGVVKGVDGRRVGAAEEVDNIPLLGVIPPAEVFHFEARCFERLLSPLDLDLQTAVGEEERVLVIDEDFHFSSLLSNALRMQ